MLNKWVTIRRSSFWYTTHVRDVSSRHSASVFRTLEKIQREAEEIRKYSIRRHCKEIRTQKEDLCSLIFWLPSARRLLSYHLAFITHELMLIELYKIMQVYAYERNVKQFLNRPWVFKEVRTPRFQDNKHAKVVNLSTLSTDRIYPLGIFLADTRFC